MFLITQKENGKSIKQVSKDLRNDKEVALKAVDKYGENLQLISEKLQNDRDIVLIAVEQNGES